MMTNFPWAASMPPIKAAPYPRSATCTSRAPSALAIAGESSVLPLSATTTSPTMLALLIAASAFRMQVPSVSASLREGITTVASKAVGSWIPGALCCKTGNPYTWNDEGPLHAWQSPEHEESNHRCAYRELLPDKTGQN